MKKNILWFLAGAILIQTVAHFVDARRRHAAPTASADSNFHLLSYDHGTITVTQTGVKYVAACARRVFDSSARPSSSIIHGEDACSEIAGLVGQDIGSMNIDAGLLLYRFHELDSVITLEFQIESATLERSQ
jgi:hypothetical protein